MPASAQSGDARELPGLASDDFSLFGLPRRFRQDRAEIDARWKQLQREAHPDRFAAAGQAAQRLALQWSARINEACQRLRDPVRRAAYLCELAGAPVQGHTQTAMPAEFLVRQMQWREALEEASAPADLVALGREVGRTREASLARCERLLDVEADAAGAAQEVRALMFVERFADDLRRRAEALEDGALAPGPDRGPSA